CGPSAQKMPGIHAPSHQSKKASFCRKRPSREYSKAFACAFSAADLSRSWEIVCYHSRTEVSPASSATTHRRHPVDARPEQADRSGLGAAARRGRGATVASHASLLLRAASEGYACL